MAFDFMKTHNLIKGGLLNPNETWTQYLDENPSWRDTAIQLTGPLIIANVLLSLIFSRIVGGFASFGYGQPFLAALVSGLVMAAISVAIAATIFYFLTGVFKGKADFSKAFAAVSLAFIPAWVAGIVAAMVPWVGWLIGLAGVVLALVYLYRIIPIALSVPEDKRVVHFVVSLVCILIVNFIVASVLGIGTMNRQLGTQDFSRSGNNNPVFGSGVIGDLERQGRLLDAAQADNYDPPSDGKLTDSQVEEYVAVLRKKKALEDDYAAEMEELSKELEAKKEAGTLSPGDIAKAYGGMGSALGVNNAEMEIVKTAGDNWAEHLWVGEQLRVARIQRGEGSDALEHNFELYNEYKEELGQLN